ncbi:hypothetical protein P4123_17155 [Pseudomonas aeruginosa]|nr:hypothetical protein [Pseudomonas aeruginosa]
MPPVQAAVAPPAAFSRFYDEALADTGLKVAQFSLLPAPAAPGRPTRTELAEEAAGLDQHARSQHLLEER